MLTVSPGGLFVNASVVLPLSSFGGRPLLPDFSVSEFCIISLVFGLKMPRGKKLCVRVIQL